MKRRFYPIASGRIGRKKVALFVAVTLHSILLFGQSSPNAKQPSAEEVTKKLSNPVASLISVPFENNTDVGIGKFNGSRNTMNFQPVIPMGITRKINLIARVICPVIAQHNIYGPGTHQTGLSDIVASAFFSPKQAKNGFVWGAGPVFLIPSATNDLLGTEKFGIGPTAVALKQTKGWTLGTLVNQIWSVAGNEERNDVSQLFVQPFIIYNWKSGAGIGLTSEITENWKDKTTSAFITPTVSGLTKIGKQIVSVKVGPRIHVAAPEARRADFGIRAQVVLVFPK